MASTKKRFNVGLVGLGKLGFPVAVAIASKEHRVMGYDINPLQMDIAAGDKLRERDLNDKIGIGALARKSKLKFGSIDAMVKHSEIIFVAVQTPHAHEYEGVTRTPAHTRDFDYSHLISACRSLFSAIEVNGLKKTVAVISTVLPGTMQRHIIPMLNKYVDFVYNPSFIAMGNTIPNFMHPEFILIGEHTKTAANTLETFFKTITDAPVRRMSIPSAELTKVGYNCALSGKLILANSLMEICDAGRQLGLDMDIDEVMDTLKLANNRLISTAYLTGGLGDGGACALPGTRIDVDWNDDNGTDWRHIEDVTTHMQVRTGDRDLRDVLATSKRRYHGDIVRLAGTNWSLELTVDHRMVAMNKASEDHRYTVAGALRPGQYLMRRDWRPAVIKKVEIRPYDGWVYNLTVDIDHHYIANGIITLNCHIRDGIAMSDLAKRWHLSHDYFGSLVEARENHADRTAEIIMDAAIQGRFDKIYFLGYAYKPESDLIFGSCALLIHNILLEKLKQTSYGADVVLWDPYVPTKSKKPPRFSQGVYFIGMNHKELDSFNFKHGSLVVDPWGCIKDRSGVRVIRIGRR